MPRKKITTLRIPLPSPTMLLARQMRRQLSWQLWRIRLWIWVIMLLGQPSWPQSNFSVVRQPQPLPDRPLCWRGHVCPHYRLSPVRPLHVLRGLQSRRTWASTSPGWTLWLRGQCNVRGRTSVVWAQCRVSPCQCWHATSIQKSPLIIVHQLQNASCRIFYLLYEIQNLNAYNWQVIRNGEISLQFRPTGDLFSLSHTSVCPVFKDWLHSLPALWPHWDYRSNHQTICTPRWIIMFCLMLLKFCFPPHIGMFDMMWSEFKKVNMKWWSWYILHFAHVEKVHI